MDKVDINLLREIADLEGTPKGAYNIRKNGKLDSRATNANIDIVSKTDKPGIDIYIKPGTKHQSVHIPVIITETGLDDLVYNDFHIGADCDVVIVAGCGIHNEGSEETKHDGIHTFYIGENARVHYVEKHYGEGEGTGERVMNPQTIAYLEKGAFLKMDTTQLRGVDSTKRYTKVVVKEGAETIVTEKLLTHDRQKAESEMDIILAGTGANGRVISRSVAQDTSEQVFYPRMIGDAAGFGHVQCDSILMGKAKIKSIPAITANHPDAQLIHEAAIGRIAGDQILKLMTLGLTEQEAEEEILNGFLRGRQGPPLAGEGGHLLRPRASGPGQDPRAGPLGGRERDAPDPGGARLRRGHHDDRRQQPAAVRHRPRRHPGGLRGHDRRPQPGRARQDVRDPGQHGGLPAPGGGGVPAVPGDAGEGREEHLRGVGRAAQRRGRARDDGAVHLRGGQGDRADHRAAVARRTAVLSGRSGAAEGSAARAGRLRVVPATKKAAPS